MRKHQVEPHLLCYYEPLVNAIQEKNIFHGKKRETTCDVIPQLSAALYRAFVMWSPVLSTLWTDNTVDLKTGATERHGTAIGW